LGTLKCRFAALEPFSGTYGNWIYAESCGGRRLGIQVNNDNILSRGGCNRSNRNRGTGLSDATSPGKDGGDNRLERWHMKHLSLSPAYF
jgi:hypothetical protein